MFFCNLWHNPFVLSKPEKIFNRKDRKERREIRGKDSNAELGFPVLLFAFFAIFAVNMFLFDGRSALENPSAGQRCAKPPDDPGGF